MRVILFLLALPLAAQNSATFIKADTTTQGHWTGFYGSSGASIAGIAPAPPGALIWTWAYSTSDPRSISVNATTWYNSAFSVDVQFPDTLQHQLSLYAADWDSTARSERIDILDGTVVLSTQVLSNFHNGTYLVWNVTGHVKLQLTSLAGANAVLFGLFFDPVLAQQPPLSVIITSGTSITEIDCPLEYTGARLSDGKCLAVKQ